MSSRLDESLIASFDFGTGWAVEANDVFQDTAKVTQDTTFLISF